MNFVLFLSLSLSVHVVCFSFFFFFVLVISLFFSLSLRLFFVFLFSFITLTHIYIKKKLVKISKQLRWKRVFVCFQESLFFSPFSRRCNDDFSIPKNNTSAKFRLSFISSFYFRWRQQQLQRIVQAKIVSQFLFIHL